MKILRKILFLNLLLSGEVEEFIAYQNKYRKDIVIKPLDNPRYIGGVDVSFVSDDKGVCCLVVLDLERDLKIVYEKCIELSIEVPYISGMLCFREGPLIMNIINVFNDEVKDFKIDVLMVDGLGTWHQRAFGLSCYVGLFTGIPCFGVSKNFLIINNPNKHTNIVEKARNELANVYDYFIIEDSVTEDNVVVQLAIMRTTSSVPFNPIYISPGHLIDMQSCINLVKMVSRYREPEPTRLADRISRKYIGDHKLR